MVQSRRPLGGDLIPEARDQTVVKLGRNPLRGQSAGAFEQGVDILHLAAAVRAGCQMVLHQAPSVAIEFAEREVGHVAADFRATLFHLSRCLPKDSFSL